MIQLLSQLCLYYCKHYTHCASFTSWLFKLKSSLWKCTEWFLISEQSCDAAVVNWLIESLPASWQIVVELCAGWNWYCRDSFIGNQQAREAYIGRSKEEDLSCGLQGNNIQKCLFQLPLCCLSSSLKYYSENKEFLSCFSHHNVSWVLANITSESSHCFRKGNRNSGRRLCIMVCPRLLGRLLYAYLHPLLGADELSG